MNYLLIGKNERNDVNLVDKQVFDLTLAIIGNGLRHFIYVEFIPFVPLAINCDRQNVCEQWLIFSSHFSTWNM